MKPTMVPSEIAKEFARDLRTLISMPQSFLEDWREDLDNALVLLQELEGAVRNLPTTASVVAGAHALVDRVMNHISNLQEQTDKRDRAGTRAPRAKA